MLSCCISMLFKWLTHIFNSPSSSEMEAIVHFLLPAAIQGSVFLDFKTRHIATLSMVTPIRGKERAPRVSVQINT